MNKILTKNKEKVFKLFEENLVSNAYVFGSIVTEKFSKNSDIDFIINFNEKMDPLESGEKWWAVYYGLKQILNRNIDIVSEKYLSNKYFIEEIEKTKVKIYG